MNFPRVTGKPSSKFMNHITCPFPVFRKKNFCDILQVSPFQENPTEQIKIRFYTNLSFHLFF